MSQEKISELKGRVAKLEGMIVDADAREHFLKVPKFWLDDVERQMAPGMEYLLPRIEQLVGLPSNLDCQGLVF